jgi:hypothetical protein
MVRYQNILIIFTNVKSFHSWTKSHKTQSKVKLELGPLLFMLKEEKKMLKINTLVALNPNF